METKTVIRKTLKQKIEALPAEERQRQSDQLCARILEDQMLQHADCLGVYLALPDEPNLLRALQIFFARGKRLFLPVPKAGENWEFHELEALEGAPEGPWGLARPPVQATPYPGELDAVLVPGRGFTPEGHRIGRGKGIYDRLLKGRTCRTIGIGFDCQRVEALPQEPTDVVLQEIWTP